MDDWRICCCVHEASALWQLVGSLAVHSRFRNDAGSAVGNSVASQSPFLLPNVSVFLPIVASEDAVRTVEAQQFFVAGQVTASR